MTEGKTCYARDEALCNLPPCQLIGCILQGDGPNEKLFLSLVTPYTKAIHEQSGQPLIALEDVEMLRAKYMEKTTPQSHVDHLHAKFSVKKVPTPPATPEVKAVAK